ncbi:MAG: CinA family protein [Bdellovibrionales bacterium]|nr:CinA family protein [Bdellovibrionales bacterium]
MEKLISQIEQWFLATDQRLGFAESCTGGLLSALITEHSGVSKYYMGTVVSYSGRVKEKLLNVPRSQLQCFGEVSVPVARSMARGSRQALQCDWSIAITGIAGPTGGSVEKPVGTVCFAVVGPGYEHVEQRHIEGSTRQEIQHNTAFYALQLLNAALGL